MGGLNMNALELQGLTKHYKDFTLGPLDLTLPGGTICGLIGENGAGKSTTIRLILDMVQRDGGTVTILGRDSRTASVRTKEEIGVVLGSEGIPLCLNAVQAGKVMAGIYHNWDAAAYAELCQKFGLPDKKQYKDYSTGMKMKLCIAVALAHHPKLLLLDEATNGLDPVVRDEILDEFQGFIEDEEHAILISSHITSDLEKIADYITYIHQGRVVLSDSKDAILEHYAKLGCTQAQLRDIQPGDLVRVRKGSFGCEALVRDRAAFARKYPGLMLDRVTLEDIMLLIGKGELA
jgi:ABC-2 type transport system ATP-binding protein